MAALERPAWLVALAIPLTIAYAVAVVASVATLVIGRDLLGIPAWVWFPGSLALVILPGSLVLPARMSRDRGHFDKAPRWFKALLGLHAAYAVVMIFLIQLSGSSLVSTAAVQAIGGALLGVCVLGAWFGIQARPRRGR